LWIYKQKLWLPDEDLNQKITLESAVPAKSKKSAKSNKNTKGTKSTKSVKNKKG